MKNVIRKITTWMLVFGMTFTPVLTSIDTVMANAGEETITITVGEQAMDFTTGNLNDAAKTAVNEAQAADNCADTAEATANAAAGVAADAKAAADIAQAAATAAADAATEAVNLQNAINAINNAQVQGLTREEYAKGLVASAETAVGAANTAAANVTQGYTDAAQAATDANDAIDTLNSSIDTANAAIEGADGNGGANAAITEANTELGKKDGLYNALVAAVTAAENAGADVTDGKIQVVKDKIDTAEASYSKADTDTQTEIDKITAELDKKLININESNKDENGNSNNLVVLTQAQEQIASDMRTGAEQERDKAIGQSQAAAGWYSQLNSLVASDTYQPEVASWYVSQVQAAAANAEQHAVNAEAYADKAEEAEAQAWLNYDASAKVLAKAVADLATVKGNRKDAYDAADAAIDALNAEDGDIADINGKIDYYNGLVQAALALLGDADAGTGYQGYVKNTNDKIANANSLWDTANSAKNAVDGADAQSKISDASEKEGAIEGLVNTYNTKKSEADTTLNVANAMNGENGVLAGLYKAEKQKYDTAVEQKVADALANYVDTKKAYDESKKNSDAAAALSDIANEKAAEVDEILNKTENQAALNAVINTDDAQNALKNALARETYEGKSYQQLTGERDTAQNRFNEADTALNNLNTTYDAAFFAEQNRIKEEQQEIYNTQNGIYNTQDGIYNDRVKDISDLNGEITKKEKEIENKTNKNTELKNDKKFGPLEFLDFLGVIGYNYEYVLDHKYDTFNFFGSHRLFTDAQIKEAEAYAKTVADNEKAIKEINETTIPGLRNSISTKKQERDTAKTARDNANTARNNANTAKNNAVSAINNATNQINDATTRRSEREGDLNTAQAKVDAVDNQATTFEYNDQNTLVVDLKDEAQYKALMSALSQAYYNKNDKYSYKYLDANTSAYIYINNNQAVPAIITSLIPYTPGYNEKTIEDTYNLDHVINTNVNLIDWLFGDDTVSADDYNTAWLQNETSKKCVIVCTDIDKLAVLRATYAQAQLAAAKANANEALTNANAAAASAKSAKESEETALGTYNTAISNLASLQNRLKLTIEGYETKEIATVDPSRIKELKTLYDKITTELAYAQLTVPGLLVDKKLGPANKTGFIELEDTVMNPEKAFEDAEKKVNEAKKAWENAKEHSRIAREAANAARAAANEAKGLIVKARAVARDYIGEDEGGSETEGGTPTPGTPASSGPILIPLTGGTTGGRTGVAGVRTPATGEGTGEGTAPADNTVAKNNISTLEETELPGAAEAPSSNLQDTDLPGAQGATDNNANLWWLWAAIALAIAIGFGIYKYADNKKKAENTIQK